LDFLKPEALGGFGGWWAILHTGDKIKLAEDWSLDPYYPLIPWIGVMAVGYAAGKWIAAGQLPMRRRLLLAGWCLTAAFLLLRFSNLYGDPDPWQAMPSPAFTLLSFINCHKYPPSLLYLLMTLGPALLIMAWFERHPAKVNHFLPVFGRTPLFYYLLHLYLLHLTAAIAAKLGLGLPAVLTVIPPTAKTEFGYGLPVVYGVWLTLLLILYPICRGFESLKANNPQWRWLNYF